MSPKDFQTSIDEHNNRQQAQADKQAQLDATNSSGEQITNAVNVGVDKTIRALKHTKGEMMVTNPDLAKSGDVADAIDAIHKLNLTTFMNNKGLPELSDNLANLAQGMDDLRQRVKDEGLVQVSKQLSQVTEQLQALGKTLGATQITVDSKLQKTIDSLSQSINAIDFSPSVNVSAPPQKVVTTPVDLKPIISALSKVEKAISTAEIPDNTIDLAPVVDGLSTVQKAIQALRFPAPNYVLPFRSIDGKAVQVQLDASGNLPTAGGGGGSGTPSAVVNVGQQTVNTTAVQISAVSTIPTNGIIIEALSTNAASIFVGGSGVTASNGFELQSGQSVSFTANLNTLYIISVASTTDKIAYNVV